MQRFNSAIMNPKMQDYIGQVLSEGKQSFVNNVVALVSANTLLQNCQPMTVVYAALKATALRLPLDPSLGQAWVVPYGNQAQFQIGSKGLVQLALRTGKFARLNVTEIKEGELIDNDILSGDVVIKALPNRNGLPTIGYAAYFRLNNGYEKTIYKSKEDVLAHAKRFSKAYNSGPWKTDFDAMARKTVLKELLSKWAPLTVEDAELNEAIKYDQSVVTEPDGEPIYVDGTTVEERMEADIQDRKDAMKASGEQAEEML